MSKCTKMGPGGNTTTNIYTYVFNKYKGQGGVGASTIPIRNAKNRLASFCNTGCKNICTGGCSLVGGNVLANMNISGMSTITFTGSPTPNNDGYAYLPFTGMDFYFFGTNYGNSTNNIYMNTSYAFGFGQGFIDFFNWPASRPAILFDFFDSYNIASYVSPPQNGTISGVKYVRIVATGTGYYSYVGIPPPADTTTVKKAYEIYYVRDTCFQYMQFNCSLEDAVGMNRTQYDTAFGGVANISNITNGTAFQNTFGSTFGNQPPNTGGPQTDGSYVIRSDLNGSNWQFFPNTHLIL